MHKSVKILLILFLILLVLSTSTLLMGILFKLQHWPGAGIMLLAGMLGEIFSLFFGLILAIVAIINKKK